MMYVTFVNCFLAIEHFLFLSIYQSVDCQFAELEKFLQVSQLPSFLHLVQIISYI